MSAPLENLLRDARIDLVLARIEKDPSVIEEVIKHIDSQIRSIRFNSLLVLGELGEKASPALSKLNQCLEDDDWSICREAIRSLGKIGTVADKAVVGLSKLIDNEELSIRKEVAISLGKINYATEEAISGLINALKDKSDEVRMEAANALGQFGPKAQDSIPALINAIKDESWPVRSAAVKALSGIGKEAENSIPYLIKALSDKDWRVRQAVNKTLTQMGVETVPSLLACLKHYNPLIRKGAVETLGEMKLSDLKIINGLAITLRDKKKDIRGRSADSLRNIGKPAIPVLIKALGDKYNIRLLAIWALGGIGSDAKDSINDLIEKLKDLNIFQRKTTDIIEEKELENYKLVLHSIKIKIKNSIRTFTNDPLSRKTKILVEFLRAIGKITDESEEGFAILCDALKDSSKFVRREAALVLGAIGPPASKATPELINLLNDPNPDIRWRASEALGKINLNTTEITSALERLLSDKYDHVSVAAEIALDNLKKVIT